MFKQTWWDNNLPTRFEEFYSWVGSESAHSKVFFREFIKNKGFESIVDLGCGPATEYFAYKKEYPEIKYLGVDSCKVLYDKNTEKGVPMILASAEATGLPDNYSDVSFSRHVLEHQPSFQPILSEMLRIGKKLAVHIFFIPPGDKEEHIGYDPSQNLYHNRYKRENIENFLSLHEKVKNFNWYQVNDSEIALIINLIYE